jgi:hypothetical protein
MIRHIVMFRLTATDPAQRAVDVEGLRSHLTALVGVIPGLQRMTVDPDLGAVDTHWDAVLVSDHDSAEAVAAYQVHPGHVEATAWVNTVAGERAVVDYEVAG